MPTCNPWSNNSVRTAEAPLGSKIGESAWLFTLEPVWFLRWRGVVVDELQRQGFTFDPNRLIVALVGGKGIVSGYVSPAHPCTFITLSNRVKRISRLYQCRVGRFASSKFAAEVQASDPHIFEAAQTRDQIYPYLGNVILHLEPDEENGVICTIYLVEQELLINELLASSAAAALARAS